VLIAGLIVAGTLISLARTPLHVWNTLWAEDGADFVPDALSRGLAAVLESHAGYMHFVARVGAWIATMFPLAVVPTAVTVVAAVFASLVACACFLFLEQRFASKSLRFAGWAICIALPIMGGEVMNNLANLHWYLLIAAFLAVLVQADRAAVRSVQATVLFVAVTSDALALLLAPFVVFRLILFRGWRDRVPDLAFLAGAALQVTVVVASMLAGDGREVADARPTVAQFIDFYTYRVVFGALFGVSMSQKIVSNGGAVLPGLVLAVAFAAIIVAVVIDRGRRVYVLVLAIGSIAFSTVVFSMQWAVLQTVPLIDHFTGGRYTTVPTALLLLALLQAADIGLSRLPHGWTRGISTMIVLVIIVAPMILDFRALNIRADAASWAAELEAARDTCALVGSTAHVSMGIAPGWFREATVSCDLVRW